mmetsp:Transcript_22399/g.62898  ORF Transcript_22399/g.62898 Transcript_22399/m.62898 type:complete len:473 (+) Transcript_22399:53-1471(+)
MSLFTLGAVSVALAWLPMGLVDLYNRRKYCRAGVERKRFSSASVGPGLPRDGAWLYKLGDAQRTGWTNRTAPRRLSPRWSFRTVGVTYSAPLVDQLGNVYIVTTTGEVWSLDPNSDTRWFYQLHAGGKDAQIWNETLFVSDDSGFGYAISTASGQPLWVRRVAQRSSGGHHGVLVGQGLAIFHEHIGDTGWTLDADFIACDAATGAERWRSKDGLPFFNVLPAFADEGSAIVYTDMDGGIHKMATETGAKLWSSPGYPFPLTIEANWHGDFGGAPRGHGALALVHDGVAYSSGNPTRYSGRVRAHRLDTGEVLWSTDVAHMMGNAAAIADIDGVRTLVFGTGVTILQPIPESHEPYRGTVYGLDARTGAVRWTYEAEPWHWFLAAGSVTYKGCPQWNLPDAFSAPSIDGSGAVYIGWHGGILYALDGRDGSLLSQFDLGEGMQSAPAIGPHGELVATAATTTYSFWPGDETR